MYWTVGAGLMVKFFKFAFNLAGYSCTVFPKTTVQQFSNTAYKFDALGLICHGDEGNAGMFQTVETDVKGDAKDANYTGTMTNRGSKPFDESYQGMRFGSADGTALNSWTHAPNIIRIA